MACEGAHSSSSRLSRAGARNRNLLVRINRELGGNFHIGQFGHRAVWNASDSRVEMHLEARRAQQICIDAACLEFTMAKNESIWTESSYKYQPEETVRLPEGAGFRPITQWNDRPDQFALTLVEGA